MDAEGTTNIWTYGDVSKDSTPLILCGARTPQSFATISICGLKLSSHNHHHTLTSKSVLYACSVILNRSVPSGTVGFRMARTSKPRARRDSATNEERSFPGTNTDWIGDRCWGTSLASRGGAWPPLHSAVPLSPVWFPLVSTRWRRLLVREVG